jgi:hypothetical protein
MPASLLCSDGPTVSWKVNWACPNDWSKSCRENETRSFPSTFPENVFELVQSEMTRRNIYVVHTFTLCIHLRCAYFYVVHTSTLCIHSRCAYIHAVHKFTLCIHLRCAYIYVVHTFTLCIHFRFIISELKYRTLEK